ncbi:MAG: threonylcarbamoyl-AMP synthase [Lachnospiraceae bacterium]|nr:threonylcarbamoyl-AMP synthase [Lachnospiraceae bacterium]
MNRVDTQILRIDDTLSSEERSLALARAGSVLAAGGLVIFPTETVYGLGANALDAQAVRRIYEAKGRPSDNPLIAHVADFSEISRVACLSGGEIRDKAETLAAQFWPGPLTMVLPKRKEVPKETSGGLDTIAVRCPDQEIARELIRCAHCPVAAPSANRSGRPSPTEVSHCIEDMDGRVDLIIDAGRCSVGIESTIVDLTGEKLSILRQGMIGAAQIAKALSVPLRSITYPQTGREDPPRAPGMKYRHYAPRGEMTVYTGTREQITRELCEALEKDRRAGKKTGVLCADERVALYKADVIITYGSEKDYPAAARRLYGALREMDAQQVEAVRAEAIDHPALMDRLLRAAGQNGGQSNQ